ncbi:MAG: GTPase ObgE [Candidatus Delongbacteria bacterium]
MFIDQVRIAVRSGNGGDGCVSLFHGKYQPKGGPDGGDGGRGGDVVFEVDTGRMNLLDFKWSRSFEAEDGRPGASSLRKGRRGKDVLIRVPPGTQIRRADNGELLLDLVEPGQREVLLNGGHGGKGNARFKSPTQQTPRYATPGGAGWDMEVDLELKILADVGLVGFPNAGKSTLLAALSAARPKIADYPFTTIVPNVGIVPYAEFKSFAMADIPGLIEGAHEGRGLGHQFLRHVERCRVLVYLVDVSADDPVHQLEVLRFELARYSPELAKRPALIVLNKSDVTIPSKRKLKMDYDLLVSAATGKHLKLLVRRIGEMLEELRARELPRPRRLSSLIRPEVPVDEEELIHPDEAKDERWATPPPDVDDSVRRRSKRR